MGVTGRAGIAGVMAVSGTVFAVVLAETGCSSFFQNDAGTVEASAIERGMVIDVALPLQFHCQRLPVGQEHRVSLFEDGKGKKVIVVAGIFARFTVDVFSKRGSSGV